MRGAESNLGHFFLLEERNENRSHVCMTLDTFELLRGGDHMHIWGLTSGIGKNYFYYLDHLVDMMITLVISYALVMVL